MKLPEVSLVVIDPARKYLTGDENDAGVVSDFFEAIEEFAIRKHAAMVVVHHLAKGAKPGHVSEIYDLLRGSQVFIDRPRVVIGMYRNGENTIAGFAKNNIPPQMGMIQGERHFYRDPERLELVQVKEQN
jgi:RecA-family ATPase